MMAGGTLPPAFFVPEMTAPLVIKVTPESFVPAGTLQCRPTKARQTSMKYLYLLLWICCTPFVVFGQQTQKAVEKEAPGSTQTAKTLLDAFRAGRFQGNFRLFFMATDNTRELTDYHALAAGGGLRFHTASLYGFRFGLGGVFQYNLASSDLGAKDPATGAANRYEIGLFDVEDPKNRADLDRMEEFWLQYGWKSGRVTLGKQLLQTPFINPQDGRMRPTAESGLWVENRLGKNTKLEGGWLWGISPRSTVRWYDIGRSIGLYPKGLNPDGTGSGYPQNIQSKGVGLLGLSREFGKNTRLQVWDQYVEHVFNSALLQVDLRKPLAHKNLILFGLQGIHQNALADGGNAEAAKTYFQKGGQSNAVSAQTGWERNGWQALLAYTYITKDGRFLAPREWGREPFYTFMSRERVEGSGNSHSVTGRVRWQSDDSSLRLEAGYGRFYLPDVHNTALNKYAFPAFQQFNADIRYAFGGALKGLKVQFLYVWKGRLGDVYGQDKLVFNRVNMSNYNLIFNYIYE